jgi:hypothetical protein
MRFRVQSEPCEGDATQTSSQPSALFVSGSLGKKGFQNIKDLILFAMRQLLDQLESLSNSTFGERGFRRPCFPENLLNRQSQGFRYWNDEIRPGQDASAFPITDIGWSLPNLPRQITQTNPCMFAQRTNIESEGLRHVFETKAALAREWAPHVKLQWMQSPMTTKKIYIAM